MFALQSCEEVKPDQSSLVKNNGFCASFRLLSKGAFFNEMFSSISSKRSSMVSLAEVKKFLIK